jgi:predicted S18 family serine protease
MEKKLEQIEVKVDKLDERLDTIEKVLIKQEKNIEIHILRTNLLEESVDLLRQEMRPIEKHVHYMHGALKLVGIISLLAGIAAAIKELFV